MLKISRTLLIKIKISRLIFLIQHYAKNKILKYFLSIRQPDLTMRYSNSIRARDSGKEKVAENNTDILFNDIALCQYFSIARNSI